MGIFEQQQALVSIAEEPLNAGISVAQVVELVIQRDLILHKAAPYFRNKDVWGNLADAPIKAATKFVVGIYTPIEAERTKENALFEKYPTMRSGFFFETPKMTQKGKLITDDFGEPVMKRVPDFDGIACYLRDICHLKTSHAYSYIYDKTHYRVLTDVELKKIIDTLTLRKINPGLTNDFMRAVVYKNFCEDNQFQVPAGLINLKNGVLDIVNKKLKPRDPSLFFKYVCPVDWDESAPCPEWYNFLHFVFDGNKELADVSAEIFGYCLAGGDPWLHKAFFLEGSGRNGKSTWLEVLKALIGKENFCTVPMRLLDKPFSVVMADGKLANIVGELDSRDVSSEAFKTAVGGEELVAAHKGKPEYSMPFLAKIIVATNNPINFKDSSPGNYEKLFILPFKKYIPEADRDRNIKKKLLSELPGILNWAVDGLQRLLKRGHLPRIDVVEEALTEQRRHSDSVYDWVTQHVKRSNSISPKVYPNIYYAHYVNWCEDSGRRALSKIGFCRLLSRELKSVGMDQVSVGVTEGKTYLTGPFSICII